jgi:hypothetical protein
MLDECGKLITHGCALHALRARESGANEPGRSVYTIGDIAGEEFNGKEIDCFGYRIESSWCQAQRRRDRAGKAYRSAATCAFDLQIAMLCFLVNAVLAIGACRRIKSVTCVAGAFNILMQARRRRSVGNARAGRVDRRQSPQWKGCDQEPEQQCLENAVHIGISRRSLCFVQLQRKA